MQGHIFCLGFFFGWFLFWWFFCTANLLSPFLSIGSPKDRAMDFISSLCCYVTSDKSSHFSVPRFPFPCFVCPALSVSYMGPGCRCLYVSVGLSALPQGEAREQYHAQAAHTPSQTSYPLRGGRHVLRCCAAIGICLARD